EGRNANLKTAVVMSHRGFESLSLSQGLFQRAPQGQPGFETGLLGPVFVVFRGLKAAGGARNGAKSPRTVGVFEGSWGGSGRSRPPGPRSSGPAPVASRLRGVSQVRSGQFDVGRVRASQVRVGQIGAGQDRTGVDMRAGQMRAGQDRAVRSPPVRS